MDEYQAKNEGLQIFGRGRSKQKGMTKTGGDPSKPDFKDLRDNEIIAYVMCQFVGWSYRRLAQLIGRDRRTVKNAVEKALQKRKI